jgi:hypothetical protein
MINTSYRYLGLSRLWLGLFYALFVLGHGRLEGSQRGLGGR